MGGGLEMDEMESQERGGVSGWRDGPGGQKTCEICEQKQKDGTV